MGVIGEDTGGYRAEETSGTRDSSTGAAAAAGVASTASGYRG